MLCTVAAESVIRPSRTIKDSEGVASVVGTILALLVFLSLLGIFMNHYVPSMMAGNEHQHDTQVITQISNLKESIDSMMLYYINSQSSTLSSYSPVTLGSAGVPMFATGTQGQLGIIPVSNQQEPSFSVSFAYYQSGVVHSIKSVSGGGVIVNMPNRYFTQQSILYQNDAVILGQTGGQVMLANPGFTINARAGISVSLLQMSIVTPTSTNVTISGTNTVGLSSQLTAFTHNTFNSRGTGPLKMTILTPFAKAWLDFFNSTFAQAGLNPTRNNGLTGNYNITLSGTYLHYVLTVMLYGVDTVTLSNAIVNIAAGE